MPPAGRAQLLYFSPAASQRGGSSTPLQAPPVPGRFSSGSLAGGTHCLCASLGKVGGGCAAGGPRGRSISVTRRV